MAWITPKTDWTAADGVRNTDFNRIEGNTQQLKDASIFTATHTRVGTINNLDIPDGAKNLTFLATADLADDDTWTVNGQPVTAVLQNGETLPGELFKSGCWVTGVYWDGTQLFLRALPTLYPVSLGTAATATRLSAAQ